MKYTDYFNEAFPYYLSIGMTYELFWHGDCTLTVSYREAAKLRLEHENLIAWLQGGYVYEAILRCAPALNSIKPRSPEDWLDEPFDFGKAEEEEVSPEEAAKSAFAYMFAKSREINKNRKEGVIDHAGRDG